MDRGKTEMGKGKEEEEDLGKRNGGRGGETM
jgi:hypothetical protein